MEFGASEVATISREEHVLGIEACDVMSGRTFTARGRTVLSWDRVRRPRSNAGFTLIELLVVITILPLVAGAIAVALVSVFSLQKTTTNRVSAAGDAQVVSSNFETDVHAAAQMTTNSAAACGTGTQLLGLRWSINPDATTSATNPFLTVVSYVEVPNGASNSLIRNTCTSGASSTPTSSSTISFDIPSAQPVPVVSPSSQVAAAAASWIAMSGVTSLTFTIAQSANTLSYQLIATPAASTATALPTVATPTNSCGLATPGTGTYAQSLCFVNFASYTEAVWAASQASGNCFPMSSSIANSSDTLTFCLKVTLNSAPNGTTFPSATTDTTSQSGNSCPATGPYGPICGATLPTYADPPTSEAFLGNNGFYTNVPGQPALYETRQGMKVTIALTNIQVTSANGGLISGWALVTGDAESTDPGESITWTTNAGAALNLLPDSPGGTQNNGIGNACPYSPGQPNLYNWPNVDLTGLNTTTVTCGNNVSSSDKTGTVMLKANAPTSLTAQLTGAGLQAIFVAVLLP